MLELAMHDALQAQIDAIQQNSPVTIVFTDVGQADDNRKGFKMLLSFGALSIVVLRMRYLFDLKDYDQIDQLTQNVMVLNQVAN